LLLPNLGHLFYDSLAAPATAPPLACITISIASLPWSIDVHPSRPHAPNAFVSVWDVLDALHYRLGQVATPEELGELASDEVRTVVWAVFEHRVRTNRDRQSREIERRAGPRRVDMLLGRTRFVGLSISDGGRHLVLDVC
jgi:hypothetical protein